MRKYSVNFLIIIIHHFLVKDLYEDNKNKNDKIVNKF